MVEEKKGVTPAAISVEAISPESMEKIATAMKEAPAARLREALTLEAAITALKPEDVDKISQLVEASRGNGGCFIGCW